MEINPKDFPGGFDVTGQMYQSTKRFKQHFSQNNACFAFNINLWRGSVWGILANGKRKLLKQVFN